MKKHAYLIMAHNQFGILKKLVQKLDYKFNDIYIHIDKKAGEFDFGELEEIVKYSSIIFLERIPIVWAGESLIECELNLFKKAVPQKYQYYHLISGADFPIKTQKEIHDFFDAHDGKEFIEFWDIPISKYAYRIRYKYPLQEKIGRYTYDPKTVILRVISKLLVFIQKIAGVDRIKAYSGEIKIGAQWVSITHSMACHLLENERQIREFFMCGVAADELFVQSICWNSIFRNNIYIGKSTRLIDWIKGKPYVWLEKDFEDIKKSECLFVRKISDKDGLVDKLYNYLCKKEELE